MVTRQSGTRSRQCRSHFGNRERVARIERVGGGIGDEPVSRCARMNAVQAEVRSVRNGDGENSFCGRDVRADHVVICCERRGPESNRRIAVLQFSRTFCTCVYSVARLLETEENPFTQAYTGLHRLAQNLLNLKTGTPVLATVRQAFVYGDARGAYWFCYTGITHAEAYTPRPRVHKTLPLRIRR